MGNKSEKTGGLGGVLKRFLGGVSKPSADTRKTQVIKEPAPPAPKAAKKPTVGGANSLTSKVSKASSKTSSKSLSPKAQQAGGKPSRIKLSHSKVENLAKPAITISRYVKGSPAKAAPKTLPPTTRQKGKDFPII